MSTHQPGGDMPLTTQQCMKPLLSNCGLLPVAILLAACATNAGQEQDRIRSVLVETNKTYVACNARITADPRFVPIYAKLHVAATPTPEAMLRDEEHYSPDLLALGLEWYSLKQQCDQAVFEGFSKASPDLSALAVGWAEESARIVQSAITVRPTYGELNRQIAALGVREREEVRRWASASRARLEQQAAAERAAQQQVALQVLAVALDALAARQAALASIQQQYVVVNNVYVTQRIIVPSRCRYNPVYGRILCGP